MLNLILLLIVPYFHPPRLRHSTHWIMPLAEKDLLVCDIHLHGRGLTIVGQLNQMGHVSGWLRGRTRTTNLRTVSIERNTFSCVNGRELAASYTDEVKYLYFKLICCCYYVSLLLWEVYWEVR